MIAGHLLKNRIKSALRERDTMFWNLLFPVMLATLFFFAFANLDSSDQFSPVKTAVVSDDAYQKSGSFKEALESVSGGADPLLALTLAGDEQTAANLLDSGSVDGYIQLRADGPELVVKADGIEQTILKMFLDQYKQTVSTVETILRNNPQADVRSLLASVSDVTAYTREIPLTQTQPSVIVTYFYALLAMVCLYGSFQGLTSVMYLQANLSPLGARRSLAPVHKVSFVLFDLLAAYGVQLLCIFILLFYLLVILGIDFGPKLGYLILTCGVGSLVGVSMGAFVASSSRLKEGPKTAILISFTMLCCFLAGLMVNGINYLIEQNAPVIAWLNPAARIVDAFYCLYYFDGLTRYFLDIGVLLCMALALSAGSALFLRRRQYESI